MCARLALPYSLMWWRPAPTTDRAMYRKEEVIDSLHLRNLRSVKLRQGLAKCRDRHRRARPIICAPLWFITSSLCVSISFLLSFSHSLPYNRTDFGQYINARIVWRGLILGSKKLPKKIKTGIFGFFLFFVFVYY